jgi:hypothetical protein
MQMMTPMRCEAISQQYSQPTNLGNNKLHTLVGGVERPHQRPQVLLRVNKPFKPHLMAQP